MQVTPRKLMILRQPRKPMAVEAIDGAIGGGIMAFIPKDIIQYMECQAENEAEGRVAQVTAGAPRASFARVGSRYPDSLDHWIVWKDIGARNEVVRQSAWR